MASTDQPTQKPSQAEGERDADDNSNLAAPQAESQPTTKPSQAEGDRATIESDIRQKEKEGKV